ncbi:hypothetical protein DTO271D3_8266 [Paecilomyces variotii]|nr:hypothetical protein DTO271D3_8266 [Paecilomyces variotii]
MFLTPPVSRENFHYSNGDFYVTSSNQNQHRRATIPELQALFHPLPGQPPTAKDPPAHWYKAQLLHYGLQPSDNKGTAAKRLLDALNQGRLEIPVNLQQLERYLKKEWDSNERKARKELAAAEKAEKAKEGTVTSKQTGKGIKRKAADDGQDIAAAIVAAGLKGINANTVNINVNLGGSSSSSSKGASTSSAKRAKKEMENDSNNGKQPKKTTKRQSTAAAADNEPKTPARKLQTARCTGRAGYSGVQSARSTSKAETEPKTTSDHAPVRKRQTARRGRGAYPGIQSRPTTTAAATSATTDDAPKPTAKKQTAKCSSRGGHSGAQPRSTSESQDFYWGMREESEGIEYPADDSHYWHREESEGIEYPADDSYYWHHKESEGIEHPADDSHYWYREESEGIEYPADGSYYWDREDSYSNDPYYYYSDKDVEMGDAW